MVAVAGGTHGAIRISETHTEAPPREGEEFGGEWLQRAFFVSFCAISNISSGA